VVSPVPWGRRGGTTGGDAGETRQEESAGRLAGLPLARVERRERSGRVHAVCAIELAKQSRRVRRKCRGRRGGVRPPTRRGGRESGVLVRVGR